MGGWGDAQNWHYGAYRGFGWNIFLHPLPWKRGQGGRYGENRASLQPDFSAVEEVMHVGLNHKWITNHRPQCGCAKVGCCVQVWQSSFVWEKSGSRYKIYIKNIESLKNSFVCLIFGVFSPLCWRQFTIFDWKEMMFQWGTGICPNFSVLYLFTKNNFRKLIFLLLLKFMQNVFWVKPFIVLGRVFEWRWSLCVKDWLLCLLKGHCHSTEQMWLTEINSAIIYLLVPLS